MLKQTITTSQQLSCEISSNDVDVINWFSNTENQTATILHQINNDRMYDPIFQGRTNLNILDLGANCGLFSLYAQDSAHKILAVEPTPNTYEVLSKLTKDYTNVVPVQAAVSDHDGTVTFYINENSTTNSLVDRSGTLVEVPATTLKNLLDQHDMQTVDFAKCDIEGSEMQVLTTEAIASVADRVNFWFVEIHQTNVKEQTWPGNLESNRQTLVQRFKDNGYETDTVIHDQLFAWK
jgi:FkbM family methyltransferase